MARVRTPTSPRVFWILTTSLNLVHEVTELAELGLGGFEDLPNLVAFFLEGEHVEAHLEAGQDRG